MKIINTNQVLYAIDNSSIIIINTVLVLYVYNIMNKSIIIK